MSFQPVILWSDALIYLLVVSVIAFCWFARKKQHIRRAWQQVIRSRIAMATLVILTLFIVIGLLDSIHYRKALGTDPVTGKTYYAATINSLFDRLIAPIGQDYEQTYSAPFALHLYVKESVEQPDGTVTREYPRLQYAGVNIDTTRQYIWDISQRIVSGGLIAVMVWLLCVAGFTWTRARQWQQSLRIAWYNVYRGQTLLPWRTFWITGLFVLLLVGISFSLAQNYHVLGTDKIGQDVFYQALKSIRTGLAIGTLTTLIILPFALLLGIMAGYFAGWVDDVIQYIYTTLSSIPSILLIAAAILSLQIYIMNNPNAFQTLSHQADMRLLALCMILGVTSWTSLCRLLRAETLKLREVDYVQAAIVLGTRRSSILLRHILPNVAHIVLITVIIDFSALVLVEGVLSYVGAGVDPTTMSWGNMINAARLELAREPVVWWPIFAAFLFMFTLVLAANLFADVVRDAFDPKTQSISK